MAFTGHKVVHLAQPPHKASSIEQYALVFFIPSPARRDWKIKADYTCATKEVKDDRLAASGHFLGAERRRGSKKNPNLSPSLSLIFRMSAQRALPLVGD